MSRFAYFHNGSNEDRTEKFSHVVVAWENGHGFRHMVKCVTPAQAAKYFAEFSDAFGEVYTVGLYPYVAKEVK